MRSSHPVLIPLLLLYNKALLFAYHNNIYVEPPELEKDSNPRRI